jgi:hypothetical protein
MGGPMEDIPDRPTQTESSAAYRESINWNLNLEGLKESFSQLNATLLKFEEAILQTVCIVKSFKVCDVHGMHHKFDHHFPLFGKWERVCDCGAILE